MRISDDTPSHLRLRDRTMLWCSAACLGATMILVGGAAYDCEPRLLMTAGIFLTFALLSLHATDVTFDKIDRTCAIRRRFMLRVSRLRLGFDDILDARVEVDPLPDNPAMPPCRLSLVTKSGVVPLSAAYQPSYERFNALRDAVLDAIFTGKPRPAPVDPIRMLAKEGHIGSAAAMLRTREGIDLKTALARVRELQKAPDA